MQLISMVRQDHVVTFIVGTPVVTVAAVLAKGTLVEQVDEGPANLGFWLKFRTLSGDYTGGTFFVMERLRRDVLKEVSPLEALAGQAE